MKSAVFAAAGLLGLAAAARTSECGETEIRTVEGLDIFDMSINRTTPNHQKLNMVGNAKFNMYNIFFANSQYVECALTEQLPTSLPAAKGLCGEGDRMYSVELHTTENKDLILQVLQKVNDKVFYTGNQRINMSCVDNNCQQAEQQHVELGLLVKKEGQDFPTRISGDKGRCYNIEKGAYSIP